MFRSLARTSTVATRSSAVSRVAAPAFSKFAAVRFAHHEAESFDDFNARYRAFFETAPDLFELQRGMNNCFSYDLVPSVETIETIIKAARKFDDYATAVRAIEGIRDKVEKKSQYFEYLNELRPLLDDLGIETKEEMYNQTL